jgi:hypothetical protein
MAACQRHDARHTKRLTQLLARLGEKPVSSIPSACRGWMETMAAYRFLENPERPASAAAAQPYRFAFTQSRSRAAVALEAVVRSRLQVAHYLRTHSIT